MEYNVTINGYTPPPVSEGGYSVTPNKIWSSNTGRSATGKMFGDIVTTKYTVQLQWSKMKSSVVSELSESLSEKPFFKVTFINEKGEKLTREFYCSDTSYSLKRIVNGEGIYNSISIELIER